MLCARLALILCLTTMPNTIVHAQESERTEPLHIKFAPTKPEQKIKITTVRVKKQEIKTPEITEKKSDKSDLLALIDKKLSGQNINFSPQATCRNRDEILAQSLKAELDKKNQDPALIDILYTAHQKTGAPFDVLVLTAMIESNLGTMLIATPPTTSARGLFQYIDETWLQLAQKYGSNIDQLNKPELTNEEILALRDNPKVSALIKGYQFKEETPIIVSYKKSENITATDHYIMHMLGNANARVFYNLIHERSPMIMAYLTNKMFQDAINLNRSFFYDASGDGLNASQAYRQFEQKIADKQAELRETTKRHSPDCALPTITTVQEKHSPAKN